LESGQQLVAMSTLDFLRKLREGGVWATPEEAATARAMILTPSGARIAARAPALLAYTIRLAEVAREARGCVAICPDHGAVDEITMSPLLRRFDAALDAPIEGLK
jgi:hypothetical protein